jgi:hypothetical protein
VVAIAGVLVVNTLIHGHPFRSPYSQNGQALLDGRMALQHIALYGAGLALIPPFPLAWIVLRLRRVDRWVLAAIPGLIFFVCYSYHDHSTRLLETLLGGQRLIVPVHAILMVATANVWANLPPLRSKVLVLVGGGLAALVQCAAVRHLYGRYEPAVLAVTACAPSRLAYNTNASRVALSTNVPTYVLVDDRNPVGISDIALLAPRAPTNQVASTQVTFSLPESLRASDVRCRQFGEFYLFDLEGRCPASIDAASTPCSF